MKGAYGLVFEYERNDGKWCKYEDAEKLNRWISVDDELPENSINNPLIICIALNCSVKNYVDIGFYVDDGFRNADGHAISVSHWQKLPNPPSYFQDT